ncbi:hypothetical protein [Nocardia huaxiensis]|uniref:hypothetical protein n=1 Tax=Nocardia huaxiensis TaxID=2755382 RepID=UPI001E3D71FE|nr:hypothetical protein [Nocardia huaxiensis]UFS97231.1 hypothetical protein LPY97_04710 [Nocardia huaxiensis]
MGIELAIELQRLENERRTGVLRTGDGAFHLADGAIACVDCRRTTALDRLVIAAGVASADAWQRAATGDPSAILHPHTESGPARPVPIDPDLGAAPSRSASGEFGAVPPLPAPDRPEGEIPRSTGILGALGHARTTAALTTARQAAATAVLTPFRPRLETLVLLSIFDAAYLLLATETIAEFEPAPAHWLAELCPVAPRVVLHECDRRGALDSGPWQTDLVDRAAVVPARRIARSRVVLTAGQAEVLAAADARRSVTAIARTLDRTAYGCLQAVRDLTAAGLIEPPAPAPASILSGAPEITEPTPGGPGPLPRRRVRQAALTPAPDSWVPADRDMLLRLRAALQELA